MENFPNEIIENILLRLPGEVALQARRVCTTWKALLRNYKSRKPGFLVAVSLGDKGRFRQEFYYEDEHDHYQHAKINYYFTDKTLSKIEHHRSNAKIDWQIKDIIIGSCNGLACFSKAKKDVVGRVPFLICNPLTGEPVLLPYCDYLELYRDILTPWFPIRRSLTSGFGYCPLTDDYKVVHLYTVGGGHEWRFIGFIGHHVDAYSACVYANGALYWLPPDKYDIVAFDLEGEKFHSVPLPFYEDFVYANPSLLDRPKLLGGNNNLYLSFASFTTSDAYRTDIWVYKRDDINTGGTKECNLKLNDHNESSSFWVEEFSIPHQRNDNSHYYYYEPFAITKHNEVLLWSCRSIPSRTRLYCYDPRIATLKILWDDNAKCGEYIAASPHTHSLVSLKYLGETDVIYLKI
ncbi:putative F-box protein At2g02030 [Papaver somniferum]|uniref:putative F-box protein At2g02030 n=1 Tax=Papaver somniferum TaxID=3469 RepID=UPI000E6FAED6|nr:putative F-box protein At2g02030 [Papaver somniferum]